MIAFSNFECDFVSTICRAYRLECSEGMSILAGVRDICA